MTKILVRFAKFRMTYYFHVITRSVRSTRRRNLIQFQRLCDYYGLAITYFCFITLRLPRPRFARPRNDMVALYVVVALALQDDCRLSLIPPTLTLPLKGGGYHAVTGEGLLHRPDCKIPEQVRDDD